METINLKVQPVNSAQTFEYQNVARYFYRDLALWIFLIPKGTEDVPTVITFAPGQVMKTEETRSLT